MRCKKVKERLDDHVDGLLAAREAEAVREHLDACAECRETSLALRTYAEDILTELRATTPEARQRAQEHLAVMLSLCELVLGESETDFLRRRARLPAA